MELIKLQKIDTLNVYSKGETDEIKCDSTFVLLGIYPNNHRYAQNLHRTVVTEVLLQEKTRNNGHVHRMTD